VPQSNAKRLQTAPVLGVDSCEVAQLPAENDPFRAGPQMHVRSWHALRKSVLPTIHFLFETEVHVYAFAVAANILMSFFPFLVAILTLCRSVFHWRAAVDVILRTLNDYFPTGFGVDFR
jgi:hypothetical protein